MISLKRKRFLRLLKVNRENSIKDKKMLCYTRLDNHRQTVAVSKGLADSAVLQLRQEERY